VWILTEFVGGRRGCHKLICGGTTAEWEKLACSATKRSGERGCSRRRSDTRWGRSTQIDGPEWRYESVDDSWRILILKKRGNGVYDWVMIILDNEVGACVTVYFCYGEWTPLRWLVTLSNFWGSIYFTLVLYPPTATPFANV